MNENSERVEPSTSEADSYAEEAKYGEGLLRMLIAATARECGFERVRGEAQPELPEEN